MPTAAGCVLTVYQVSDRHVSLLGGAWHVKVVGLRRGPHGGRHASMRSPSRMQRAVLRTPRADRPHRHFLVQSPCRIRAGIHSLKREDHLRRGAHDAFPVALQASPVGVPPAALAGMSLCLGSQHCVPRQALHSPSGAARGTAAEVLLRRRSASQCWHFLPTSTPPLTCAPPSGGCALLGRH